MPLYTVLVTVKVFADTQDHAYGCIHQALIRAKQQGLIEVDQEVIDEEEEEEDVCACQDNLTLPHPSPCPIHDRKE